MFKRIQGFTLIELMVTVAVLAIVLSIAVPSFQTLITNNKSQTMGDEFAQALNFARSEAVKNKKRVSICASSNGTSCTGSWSEGFIVFQDNAASDTAAAISLGPILKVWPKLSAAGTFSVMRNTTPAATSISFIRYTSLGTLAPIGNATIVASLKLTGCTGKAARKISVNLSGFVNVQSDDC